MMNSNYKKAKILTLIPVIVFVATVICFVFAAILQVPTNRGLIYTVFAFAGLMSLFLAHLPCLLLSVFGTVFASKAIKEGIPDARRFLILGILEILVYVPGVILAVLMFIAGQGV